MIIILVAASHKLSYYRSRIMAGLIDHPEKVTFDSIETAIDKWIFVEPKRNWYNKLCGVAINRIYICRNGVKFTDEARKAVIPSLITSHGALAHPAQLIFF